jgi:hypothetical protein
MMAASSALRLGKAHEWITFENGSTFAAARLELRDDDGDVVVQARAVRVVRLAAGPRLEVRQGEPLLLLRLNTAAYL